MQLLQPTRPLSSTRSLRSTRPFWTMRPTRPLWIVANEANEAYLSKLMCLMMVLSLTCFFTLSQNILQSLQKWSYFLELWYPAISLEDGTCAPSEARMAPVMLRMFSWARTPSKSVFGVNFRINWWMRLGMTLRWKSFKVSRMAIEIWHWTTMHQPNLAARCSDAVGWIRQSTERRIYPICWDICDHSPLVWRRRTSHS